MSAPELPEKPAVVRSPAWILTLGSVLAGVVFHLVLLAGPEDDTEPAAWGLAIVAAAVAIALVLAVIRISARPDGPAPGRLRADYLLLLAGTVWIAIIGYPIAAAMGLSTGTL
ncbi:hypothetical protein AB0L40_03135 [Patulibacter sp. NPDC049589]|uniref:hypothetical protein n=1 Tax=Patulibacter sp. NPDC049589 TaxID=3154731 RepID=UPI00344529B3